MDERTAFFRFSGFTNLIQDQIVQMAIHIGQGRNRMERISGWHVFYPAVLITGCFYLVVQTL
jgi:hypothetical protein